MPAIFIAVKASLKIKYEATKITTYTRAVVNGII